MCHVESRHDNHREDRINLEVGVQAGISKSPSWTPYVNDFDEPILFMCGLNEYLREATTAIITGGDIDSTAVFLMVT